MTGDQAPRLDIEEFSANKLRELRETARLSVRGLSEAVSRLPGAPAIGPNAISQAENRKRRISISDAWWISRALNVSPSEFFPSADPEIAVTDRELARIIEAVRNAL